MPLGSSFIEEVLSGVKDPVKEFNDQAKWDAEIEEPTDWLMSDIEYDIQGNEIHKTAEEIEMIDMTRDFRNTNK